MAMTYTLRTDTPAGSDDPREADDRMREIKLAFVERFGVDHYIPASATNTYDNAATGDHTKVTLRTGSAPSAVADKGFVYAKDVSGKAELFYRDEDGDEVQITSGGILNSCNLTGDQTVAGAKIFSGILTLADSSQLASSAAPTADADIANKKYVDDSVGSANYTPTSYAGGESVTFPNGLIIKMGVGASVGLNSSKTITFGTAFPNNIISVVATKNGALYTAASGAQSISASSKTAFTYANGVAQAGTFNWIAIGY